MVNPKESKIFWLRPKNVEGLEKLHVKYIETHRFDKEMKFGTFVNNILEHVIETHDLLKEIDKRDR